MDHVERYVVATARNPGQESIWGMPITAAGELDSTRQSFTIPLSVISPRALEVTDDGQYLMVASSNDGAAQKVNVFKLNFDSGLRFLSANKIFEQSIGTSAFMGSMMSPRN